MRVYTIGDIPTETTFAVVLTEVSLATGNRPSLYSLWEKNTTRLFS